MSGQLKFGLLGHNIAYSRSAEIFNAIFDIEQLNGSFENFDLDPVSFDKEFQTIFDKGISGLSVTIPYKSRVIPKLTRVSSLASSLDAVNSIEIRDKQLIGDNTDVIGFGLPLKPCALQLKRSNALILGCGGSAKAAVFSLKTDYEISEFTVLGRSADKLGVFKQSLKDTLRNSLITTALFDDFTFESSTKYAIVVNCTPLGGWNFIDKSPLPRGFKWDMSQIYYDLNYNLDNQIVSEASKNNLVAINGSPMLVGQAIRSFEIWTGKTISFEKVYNRVFGRTQSHPG